MSSVKEQVRKAIFGKLRTLRRNLTALGVPQACWARKPASARASSGVYAWAAAS